MGSRFTSSRRLKAMLPLALGVVVLAGAAGEARAVGLYRFVDLGEGVVTGLNNRGDYTINTSAGGFVSFGGTRTAVGSSALGLNDRGQVITGGGTSAGGSSYGGAIWENGSVTESFDFNATKINNRGDVIGYQVVDGQGGYLPFTYSRSLVRWKSTGETVDLMADTALSAYLSPHLLTGELTFAANDINDSGTIAGALKFQDHTTPWGSPLESYAYFVGENGGAFQYWPVDGLRVPSEYNAIGNEGFTYAGTLYDPEYGRNPTVYAEVNGTVVDDSGGPFSPGDLAAGRGIDVNDANQILATRSSSRSGPFVPQGIYLWDQQWYFMPDLLTADSLPGYTLENPLALNDLGQVIGYSFVNGSYRSWMLTPFDSSAPPVVPEPGTIVLAMAACPVALLWVRRRQKQRGGFGS